MIYLLCFTFPTYIIVVSHYAILQLHIMFVSHASLNQDVNYEQQTPRLRKLFVWTRMADKDDFGSFIPFATHRRFHDTTVK